MKTINLKGGLGNQMFQYAYGRSLELSGKKISFNTYFFHGGKSKIDTVRDYKLDNYQTETKANFSDKQHPSLNLIDKILTRLGLVDDGYWQSEKYFIDKKDVIRKEFTLRSPLSQIGDEWKKKIMPIKNSISLHIRRGDYLKPDCIKFFGPFSLEYYNQAIKEITKMIKNEGLEIFVFSDDIEWAKNNLAFPYQTYFVSNPQIPDYEEMYLMSLCKHNIIANSTFSWWGAWLNRNPGKIVIGPKQWFANKTSNEIDILPKTWIQI